VLSATVADMLDVEVERWSCVMIIELECSREVECLAMLWYVLG